jgi:hypothetical protein
VLSSSRTIDPSPFLGPQVDVYRSWSQIAARAINF